MRHWVTLVFLPHSASNLRYKATVYDDNTVVSRTNAGQNHGLLIAIKAFEFVGNFKYFGKQ
jgi:hypothetical protein